ncbi:MAG: TetR/AcrR family transcriptional regulator [Propionicimonas sp.]
MSAVKGPHSTRQAKAAATRQRIIEAATVEFIAHGYHGAVMAAIAERAGVAVQTVYFVFHTKPELFAAALDAAVLGPEDEPPLQQSWASDAAATPDPVAALRVFIHASAGILERASALSEVAHAAAVTDPELAAVYHSRDTLRSDGYRDFIHQLTLPPGVDAGHATDLLIALHSPRLYQALRDERGWTHQQITTWMTQTIPDLVLRPSPPTAPAGS